MRWLQEGLSAGAEPNVTQRLRQYERRERIILWTGASLGGLIALFAAIEFSRESDLPAWLLPVVPLLIIVSGGFAAAARIRFEAAAELLTRGIGDQTFAEDDYLPDDLLGWPILAEFTYVWHVRLAGLAGLALVTIVIWSAVIGPERTESVGPPADPTAITSTAITSTATPTTTPLDGLLGDADCNHKTNETDALFLLQFQNGLIPTLPCPENGDVNGTGTTNSLDAILILQLTSGLISSLPP